MFFILNFNADIYERGMGNDFYQLHFLIRFSEEKGGSIRHFKLPNC